MGAGNEDSSSTPLLISFHLIFLVTCCTHLFLSVTGKMENSLLMTLTALLLLGVREGTSQMSNITNITNTNFSTPKTIPTQTPCPKTIHYITQFVLARLKVKRGKSPCEGQLFVYFPNKTQAPLCVNSHLSESWWNELCKDMRCGDYKGFKTTNKAPGHVLTGNMTLISERCAGLQIICEDPLGRELSAYKAVTGILIFLMLGVILVQYGQPTYKAIRKRFSQKRETRWVGPTQSQSVSYHRGQGPPNNNTLKRQSFPGLERLTVNTSREPSSNRNSDYDSYGFN
ncbi:T-cell surface glycoprotein CD5 [Pimephales promelas]|uniref:T-cell surface glycoprotein CD5 n=1 Tax=Pimephales promelas TaxID=90988 RepID=UPI001955C161|nr:T-cell surface glycoprotein CD5 [Pimephales promelas]